jgi:HEAT repeat protein
MNQGKRQKAKGQKPKQIGCLAMVAWLLLFGGGATAQTLKAPALYEQCQPLVENPAQTEALTKQSALLKSGDVKQRTAAAQALAKTCDPRATPALLEALKDEDAAIRRGAIEALGKLGSAETVEALIEALQDRDWQVRAALGLTLGSFNIHAPRNATLNVLVNTGGAKVTDEGDMRARCFGVLVVNQMRDVRFSRKAISFLFDFLDNDNPKLRAVAEATAAELKHTRNGYHELIGILKQHNYPDFRRKAAYWLGEWQQSEARAALAEAAIADKDPIVQQTAKAALEKLK